MSDPSNGIIPMITGSISVISSITVIIMVLRSREKLSHIYHRLMVGFSTADIIVSAAMSLGTLPGPKGNVNNAWKTLGSQSTCDAQGFFFMFGASSAPLYFLSLQIYYLCVIKYEISLDEYKMVELFLHGVPFIVGLVCAIVPLATESINPSSSWCWVQPYPQGCDVSDVECTRGLNAGIQRWVFIGGPLIIILVLASIVMWMIYSAVRDLDRLNASHDFRCTATQCATAQCTTAQCRRTKEDRPAITSLRSSLSSIVSSVKSFFEPVEPRISARYRRSRQARERIFHYYIAYLLTIFFPLINVPIAMATGSPVNVLEVLMFIFYPLQGFFNMLVFILPNLKAVRQRDADLSFLCVFTTAIITYAGPRRITTRQSSHRRVDTPLTRSAIETAESRISRLGNSDIDLPRRTPRSDNFAIDSPETPRPYDATFDSPSMDNEVLELCQDSADDSEP